MDFKEVQRDFEEKVLQSARAAHRVRRIWAFTKSGRVRKLTAALDDADMFLPMFAAEELGKTGRVDAVPGICRALNDPALRDSAFEGIMDALQNPARVEAAFREQLLPVVISVAVHSERERKPWDAVRAALALSPGRGACELLLAAARAGIAFQLEVLLEIVNVGCGGLPVSDLIPAAEALLPHRDNIRAAEAFDAHMKRLVADGSVKLSNSLQETVEAQRTDAVATDSAFAGMSRTLRRIAQSGKDHWSMISELHQALDDRFAREGISVGFNENREFELQHLTRPEWIIRTLNCFLCGCENSGSLHRQAEMGIPLVEYFDEVGIAGCARALRAIEGVMKEEEARVGSVPDDELYGDSYYARLEAVEREAEGMEECCRQLWRFALRYREEILRVD